MPTDRIKNKLIGLPVGSPTAVISPVVNIVGVWAPDESTPASDSFLLMENGDYVLQEDNTSKLILE